MLDDVPQNRHDDAGWFRHFRMTKYLPAVTTKFDAAMAQTIDDATASKAVMTAYAAAALDILLHMGTPPKNIAADLAETFKLTPQHFLLLELDDFARLSSRSRLTLGEALHDAGFLVHDGTVAGFRLPADARRPPRIPQPKP
ncbi:MAG: hypothetical protein Q8K65_08300 [Alphaproteobacteria bacterium]|nr:hypothetical protein [Alphaproteobacteria bacterium]